ncbi:hypothetical protein JCM3775_007434 [Rhodotorula graminis]
MPAAASFGPTHTFLRGLAAYAFASFWHRVLVLAAEADGDDDDEDGDGEVRQGTGRGRTRRETAEERVPNEGTPCIVVANHWNSAADVAVLSCYFPHYRKLHYWAKSTLFAPGLPRKILLDAGNIPVDRKTKDNQKLFAASFDALKCGEAIAVFPEGGSETVHELPALKDGASWAALEYAKNLRDPAQRMRFSDGSRCDKEPVDVVICVAGIAYSDKTKYRASATMEFGPTLSVTPYVDEFLVSPKAAVKKLTARIHLELTRVTVNAPDWESRHAAMMARKILWPDDRKLPLENLRKIDQTLVDLFASPKPSRSLRRLGRLLNAYRDALHSTGLSHLSLSSLPLPATLDPDVPHPPPTRFRVLGSVLLSTLSCLVRLPFFLLPLVVHLPVYTFARYASSGALEEDQAQNKVAIGLVLALATYAALFGVVCALLWTSITWGGAIVVALVGTIAFVAYHNRLVDANYRQFQRLSALWTVLFALWTPVARSEAEHFLHSVHPSLTPSSIRLRHSSDNPYDEDTELGARTSSSAADDSDRRGLLEGAAPTGRLSDPYDDESDESDDDGGDDDDDEHAAADHADGRVQPRTPRHPPPQPSPSLFSEQDRLLGGPSRPSHSPAPSHAHAQQQGGRERAGSSPGPPQPRDLPPHEAGATRIEMDALGSGTTGGGGGGGRSGSRARTPSSSSAAAAANGSGGGWVRRSRSGRSAREVRDLLYLRAQTVQLLRALLFPLLDEHGDLDDDSGGGLEEVHVDGGAASRSSGHAPVAMARRRSLSSASSSPAPGAGPGAPHATPPASTPVGHVNGLLTRLHDAAPLSERETTSRALAREVGGRMRELGWQAKEGARWLGGGIAGTERAR